MPAAPRSVSDAPERGWPLQWTDDRAFPIPWVTGTHELGQLDEDRVAECRDGSTCQVCGLGFEDRAYAFVKAPADEFPPGRSLSDGTVDAMDRGLLHLRCARLSATYCPGLKAEAAERMLVLVEVPAGRGVTDIDGADCSVVALEA